MLRPKKGSIWRPFTSRRSMQSGCVKVLTNFYSVPVPVGVAVSVKSLAVIAAAQTS